VLAALDLLLGWMKRTAVQPAAVPAQARPVAAESARGAAPELRWKMTKKIDMLGMLVFSSLLTQTQAALGHKNVSMHRLTRP
jgi:hypothetical protein